MSIRERNLFIKRIPEILRDGVARSAREIEIELARHFDLADDAHAKTPKKPKTTDYTNDVAWALGELVKHEALQKQPRTRKSHAGGKSDTYVLSEAEAVPARPPVAQAVARQTVTELAVEVSVVRAPAEVDEGHRLGESLAVALASAKIVQIPGDRPPEVSAWVTLARALTVGIRPR